MTHPCSFLLRRLTRLTHAFSALLLTTLLHAQSGTGTVEGRVSIAAGGDYLQGVRITVPGTTLEAFTDAAGYYRLGNVPAGTVQLSAFRTGLPTQTLSVAVAAGGVAVADLRLGGDPSSGPIRLGEFKVETSREMQGAALAINEQRFAPNMKSVVSTDELGNVAEGNVAEFLKYVPGVTIDYVGGNARSISINGVPPANTPVNVDGFSVASAGGGGSTARNVEVDFISINNISRVEVSFAPTPDTEGSALSGSVNMVPRSAFERARPVLNVSTYVLMRDNYKDFARTPGPFTNGSRKIRPGFDFSYVVPVNKRFGFTVSGGESQQYSDESVAELIRHGTTSRTNGTTFPNTTPDQPYLTQFILGDRPKDTRRVSFGATVDYKLTERDRLSLGYIWSLYDNPVSRHDLFFVMNSVAPGSNAALTRSQPGQGELRLFTGFRYRYNKTMMPTLSWRHTGTVWNAEAGLGYSQNTNETRGSAKGAFRNTTARRQNVTLEFANMTYLRPGTITARDAATGALIDPHRIEGYSLISTEDQSTYDTDRKKTLFANATRRLDTAVPVSLKAGLDVREASRDSWATSLPLNYLGPDQRANSGDEQAAPFIDLGFAQRTAPYGFPGSQFLENSKVRDRYLASPGQFTLNENNRYRADVQGSKYVSELISAAFLRGDVAFLNRRLKLVGGLRAEQTNVEAEGPRSDPTRNVQRDASGRPILNAAGTLLPITTDALAASRLTLIERGATAEKEYLRLFPSLNVSYDLRQNLIARAAYYESVGRPNFNQYAGGITLPDTSQSPSTNNRITVNNASIKAWSSRNVALRLEYYFEGVGQISVGTYRREIENFFRGSVLRATPEFLEFYGLDPAEYGNYEISTQANVAGKVRMEGVDFGYKQALTFLPAWARGVQVFANASSSRVTGANLGSFTGVNSVPKTASWGASLTREKFNVRTHWHFRGRQRLGEIAPGGSIAPGTYTWASKRLTVDLIGEYNLSKRFAVFANLRNIGDTPFDLEVAGPNTPVDARLRSRSEFGSLWTFGVKGTF